VNNMLMEDLPGASQTSYSVDSASTEDGDPAEEATTEYLRTVDLPGIAPSVLELKVGAPVMLMRNLNTRVGLCNGTRLVVTRLGRRVIGCFYTADHTFNSVPLLALTSALYFLTYDTNSCRHGVVKFPTSIISCITVPAVSNRFLIQ